MNKTSTSTKSDLTLVALLSLLLLIFLISSCSTRMDREVTSEASAKEVIAKTQQPAATVASIEVPTEEAYFDMIAKTSSCLGEDLWIGGKVQTSAKVIKTAAGSTNIQKVYEVKDLTATGLNSNDNYTLLNEEGTLKAVYDEEGVLYIKLAEGPIKLISKSGTKPLTVAYEPVLAINSEGESGFWRCK